MDRVVSRESVRVVRRGGNPLCGGMGKQGRHEGRGRDDEEPQAYHPNATQGCTAMPGPPSSHLARLIERELTREHGIEAHPSAPEIDGKGIVTHHAVVDNLGALQERCNSVSVAIA